MVSPGWYFFIKETLQTQSTGPLNYFRNWRFLATCSNDTKNLNLVFSNFSFSLFCSYSFPFFITVYGLLIVFPWVFCFYSFPFFITVYCLLFFFPWVFCFYSFPFFTTVYGLLIVFPSVLCFYSFPFFITVMVYLSSFLEYSASIPFLSL